MIDPHADPRTEDTLAYDLLSAVAGGEPEVVGRATFRNGEARIEAPDGVQVAVEELLARPFVDRVQADERPRGYRRTGEGTVEMLIPGMAEHFIARMRGLWLSYPDGSVVTASPAIGTSAPAVTSPDSTDVGPPVIDAVIRRATLRSADENLNVRPLTLSHPPETGIRPIGEETSPGTSPLSRSDCGWLV
jgi:hypothetical protein